MRNSIEIARQIEIILERIDMKPTELADRIGVDRSTVSRYLKGTRKISMDDIPKIASAIGVSPVELLVDEKDKEITNLIEVSQRTVRIPVLGEIACGNPILVEENFEDYRTVLEDNLPAGDLVYLQAKGDSMSPTIPNGSMVLLRIQEEVENGEIAAITFNLNAHATLKRVKKQNGITILMPDNPAHEPIVITRDNPVRIIGKAVKIEIDL